RTTAGDGWWIRRGVSRVQRGSGVPIRDIASPTPSENLWRRNRLSFSGRFHRLLSAGRQFFLAQRTQICSSAAERDCTRIYRDAAGGGRCGKRRKSGDCGIGRGGLSRIVAARRERERAEWNFSALSVERKVGERP